MKKFFIAICLLAGLTACHHDDDETPEDKTAKRTVLVYMAAENNLSSYATDDLNEMKIGSKSLADNQNLIVYVDKANASTSPYLARIKDGELVDTLFMPEGLAADPAILASVIQKTRELYPAKSYGLMLWGHASGWLISTSDSISKSFSRSVVQRAYGGSTGNNSSSGSGKYWMNIVPMAKAIKSGLGSDHLTFVFGDCCSFGCLEVAYELKDVCDYVLGSPAEVPDMGAPFDLNVPDMFVESENFYVRLLDNYYNYYLDVYKTMPERYYNKVRGDLEGYSVPLAAIKTSELDNLANATNSLLGTITEKVSTAGSLDLDGVMFYAISSDYRYSYDMCHVLQQNTSASAFNTWKTVFNQAVPYHLYSQKWMTNHSRLMSEMDSFTATENDCGSVSMFFPATYYSGTKPNWNKAIQEFQWNNKIHWEQYGW